MQAEDLELVQHSLMLLMPNKQETARVFYDRLFALDPAARPLFTRDMEEQGRKFMSTLSHLIHGLDRLDMVRAEVQQLGRDHVRFGVQRKHYPMVETALMSALGDALGEEFTPEVESAWRAAYEVLAGIMLGETDSAT